MAIVRWSPWWASEFDDFDKNFSDFSQNSNQINNFTPLMDVYQNKNNIMVDIPLPGVNPEKVEIFIENDILVIKGTSKQKKEIEEKKYYRKEVKTGSFFRSVSLPTHVIGDKAEAKYDNGVLKITIPKAPESKPKTIKIKMTKDKK